MKDEIKVGEYVRTNKGYVVKIDKEKKNLQMLKFLDVEYGNILKHSKNIIDLIEECDYVNGKKIDAIFDSRFKIQGVAERVLCFETDFPIEKGIRVYHNYDIKSIVTKEQFANMEYKVKD